MAFTKTNLKITWDFNGDIYAVKGFNVAITEAGKNPVDETIEIAKTGKENFEHTFRGILLEKGVEHTAWVQALYDNIDSEWESVGGLIAQDDDTATIVTKDQHDEVADGVSSYTTPGPPTNEPVPQNIEIVKNHNGTIDIRVEWAAYTQGELKADMLFLFWKQGNSTGITTPNMAHNNFSLGVNTGSASYYEIKNVSENQYYRVGIAAARKTKNGIEVGNIISPPSWTDIDIGDALINHNYVSGEISEDSQAGNGKIILDSLGIRQTDGNFHISPGGDAKFAGRIEAKEGYISEGVTIGETGKTILDTIDESLKNKVNLIPPGAKLWHFDKHFTSTQGEMITIIEPN